MMMILFRVDIFSEAFRKYSFECSCNIVVVLFFRPILKCLVHLFCLMLVSLMFLCPLDVSSL